MNTGDLLCDLVTKFHERGPFVGGLYNAYEKAVHYGLATEALRAGYLETDQELPIGRTREKCDVVLKGNDTEVWIEVKQWWFLYEPYHDWTLEKYKNSILSDWDKLRHLKNAPRAVMLLRTWDATEESKKEADAWLGDIAAKLEHKGGIHATRDLKHCTFVRTVRYDFRGDVHVWWA